MRITEINKDLTERELDEAFLRPLGSAIKGLFQGGPAGAVAGYRSRNAQIQQQKLIKQVSKNAAVEWGKVQAQLAAAGRSPTPNDAAKWLQNFMGGRIRPLGKPASLAPAAVQQWLVKEVGNFMAIQSGAGAARPAPTGPAPAPTGPAPAPTGPAPAPTGPAPAPTGPAPAPTGPAPAPTGPAPAPTGPAPKDPAKQAREQEMMRLTQGRGLERSLVNPNEFVATVPDPKNSDADIRLTYDSDYNLIKQEPVQEPTQGAKLNPRYKLGLDGKIVPVETPPATPPATTETPAEPVVTGNEPISIGGQKINPKDPLYQKIMQQLRSGSTTTESFDHSKSSLYKKLMELRLDEVDNMSQLVASTASKPTLGQKVLAKAQKFGGEGGTVHQLGTTVGKKIGTVGDIIRQSSGAPALRSFATAADVTSNPKQPKEQPTQQQTQAAGTTIAVPAVGNVPSKKFTLKGNTYVDSSGKPVDPEINQMLMAINYGKVQRS